MREQPQYWSEEKWRRETRKATLRAMILTTVLCTLGIALMVWFYTKYGWS
jgi:hypothetical protein